RLRIRQRSGCATGLCRGGQVVAAGGRPRLHYCSILSWDCIRQWPRRSQGPCAVIQMVRSGCCARLQRRNTRTTGCCRTDEQRATCGGTKARARMAANQAAGADFKIDGKKSVTTGYRAGILEKQPRAQKECRPTSYLPKKLFIRAFHGEHAQRRR